MNIARRITAILLLEPALDANYEAVKQSTYEWPAWIAFFRGNAVTPSS